MKKSIFTALLLSASVFACGNTVTGDGDDTTADGGGTTGTSSTAEFVGQWNYSTGTGSLTCPNEPTQTLSAMGVLTISAGSTPGTITTSSTANGSNCVTVFTVSGNAATANPNQVCTLTGDDGTTEKRTAAGSFTIVNTTLTGTIGGPDEIVQNGATYECNLSGTITYTKIGS